ncbi:hypothetical protein OSB04_019012 [Centaurea solstitialis]|uniref:Uncharacterized protein n=1 Tax=Centaurea solstitialis TaxID=347529 RepID=A0AA38WDT5_9ASTR|nr:hypothetical protein OSB04_019012 [Centaurea solstitialis]
MHLNTLNLKFSNLISKIRNYEEKNLQWSAYDLTYGHVFSLPPHSQQPRGGLELELLADDDGGKHPFEKWIHKYSSEASQSHRVDLGVPRPLLNVKRVELLRVTFLAFYPEDNNIIAIGMNDSTIQIYSVWVDENRSEPLNVSSFAMTALASSPEWFPNDYFLSSTKSYKKKSRSIQSPLGYPSSLVGETKVPFHNDQHHVLVVHESQIATIYDNQLECLRLTVGTGRLRTAETPPSFWALGETCPVSWWGNLDGVAAMAVFGSLCLIPDHISEPLFQNYELCYSCKRSDGFQEASMMILFTCERIRLKFEIIRILVRQSGWFCGRRPVSVNKDVYALFTLNNVYRIAKYMEFVFFNTIAQSSKSFRGFQKKTLRGRHQPPPPAISAGRHDHPPPPDATIHLFAIISNADLVVFNHRHG